MKALVELGTIVFVLMGMYYALILAHGIRERRDWRSRMTYVLLSGSVLVFLFAFLAANGGGDCRKAVMTRDGLECVDP